MQIQRFDEIFPMLLKLAGEQPMADVFISYKRDERAEIERIASALRSLGLSVWFDAGLSAGEAFSDEIDREARAASAVLVCWSPTGIQSRWVKAEALIGFEGDKLVSAIVSGPDGLRPPAPFNAVQAQDLRAWLREPTLGDPGWRRVLRRMGEVTGRADIAAFAALDQNSSVGDVRAWLNAYENSPLAPTAKALLPLVTQRHEERTTKQQGSRDRLASREGASTRQDKRTPWALLVGGLLVGVVILLVVMNVIPLGGNRTQLTDGQRFDDCNDGGACPTMVVIPAGTFLMGAPRGEERESHNVEQEAPQHRVAVSRFAASVTEITFDQWDACVAGGGCRTQRFPGDYGWGRGQRPVIMVSFQDANEYVEWLSARTGQPYRLLSEAEWEYASRAGTQTPFSTGATISPDQAQYDWQWGYGGGPTATSPDRTAEVASFPANPFGMHDMNGNVREWVQDCWHNNYSGAPSDGSAWLSGGDCETGVVRGGGWTGAAELTRSAVRGSPPRGDRDNSLGFRVARSID